jgi:hypothetical protein
MAIAIGVCSATLVEAVLALATEKYQVEVQAQEGILALSVFNS